MDKKINKWLAVQIILFAVSSMLYILCIDEGRAVAAACAGVAGLLSASEIGREAGRKGDKE